MELGVVWILLVPGEFKLVKSTFKGEIGDSSHGLMAKTYVGG
jgi:hypothetical protein